MEKNIDQEIVHSFLSSHPLMTLVTVSTEGVPQSAAVYVYVDKNMTCYCVTRKNTRKFENVTAGGVALLSAHDENMLMFGEVLCDAVILTAPEEVAQITLELQRIISSRRSGYWVPPVSQLSGSGYEFIKMQPRTVTFVNYEKSSSESPVPHIISYTIQRAVT